MEETNLDLDSLEIAPLDRGMIKGAFNINDEKFKHLINWFKTVAVYAQEERKCKTYVAKYKDEIIGYIALTMAVPDTEIPGLSNTTKHNPQMILIGKLYVLPKYRSMGTGGKLMDLALDLAIRIDEMVGCIGILVDSNNDEKTVRFYKRFGFEEISRSTRTVKMFFKISSTPLLTDED